jgi:hypothetical protein
LIGPDVDSPHSPHRLTWHVPVSSGDRLLDIQLPVVGDAATIEVDGHRIGRIRTPSIDRPWSEATIDLEGTPVTVFLAWNKMAPLTDVFVDQASLRDGRGMEEARRSAPLPVRGFDLWFRLNIKGVSDLRLCPPWFIVLTGTVLIGILVVIAWGLKGLAAGIVAGGGIDLLGFLVITRWVILTAKTHRYLSGRPELGDLRRAVILVGVFLAFPLVVGGLFVAGWFFLQAIEGSIAPR